MIQATRDAASSLPLYGDLCKGTPVLDEHQDAFGFLLDPWHISLPDIEIMPRPEHEDTKKSLLSCAYNDGSRHVLYWPSMTTYSSEDMENYKLVPGSRRPSHMYQPVISHRIAFTDGRLAAAMRPTLSRFLILFLSYLGGTRLQFWDHHIDTQLVFRPEGRSFVISAREVPSAVSAAMQTFGAFRPDQKEMMLAALYLHTRSHHETWDWLRFMQGYMALDALRRVYQSGPKRDDIEDMCIALGIPCDPKPDGRIKTIVDIRNELFHRGVWAGEIPGYAVTNKEWTAILHLSELNDRVVAALLKVGKGLRTSTWGHLQMVGFGT